MDRRNDPENMKKAKELRFKATTTSGDVSALLLTPDDADWLLVFAHGAGAGMRHSFMEAASRQLATHGVATFRYQFPYIEHGGKRPDPKTVLLATVRSAIKVAVRSAPGLMVLIYHTHHKAEKVMGFTEYLLIFSLQAFE